MDFGTSTEGGSYCTDLKIDQENNLLTIIKEICGESEYLSTKLKTKVNRIIADCDLKYYSSLHRVSTADESTTTVLGFMHQTNAELTYDEQIELNQAILKRIDKKLPTCKKELEQLKKSVDNHKNFCEQQLKELKDRDNMLDTLHQQENEKMELMMEWLNHRMNGVSKFSDNTSELLTLKTKILDLKSKILHLQILHNMFTETNQSIKAYTEIHKDLKDDIKKSEQRIKHYREIINEDFD